jgi:hypothetical protein
MSVNIYIEMELNFLKINSFFHQLIIWLSVVMHNNMKPKFSHFIMKWLGMYIFNSIMQFDSFFISNIYVEIYNFVKFQNVKFTALILNFKILKKYLFVYFLIFLNYKCYEITVIFIFIFGKTFKYNNFVNIYF